MRTGELEKQTQELQVIAGRIRGEIVKLSHRAGTPHLGGSLSCVDMLVATYFGAMVIDPTQPDDPGRDRFILSKGHAATSLYTTLAARGFFPVEDLATFAEPGSHLAEHPGPGCAPGVEAGTGSLGHGLSLGVGMAMAGRIHGYGYRTFVVLSDGECNEGSVWEAALMAAAQKLDRLVVMVDFNKWQATGRSREVMALDPLREKWASFGFSTYELDGHDMGALLEVLQSLPDGSGKPIAIIGHTVKGKGVSFMEDDNNWHYRIPSAEEVTQALAELGGSLS